MKHQRNKISVSTIDTVIFIEKAKYERQLDAVRRIGQQVSPTDCQILEEFDKWQKVIDDLGSLVNGDESKETLDILINNLYATLKSAPRSSAEKITASMLHDRFSRVRESYVV